MVPRECTTRSVQIKTWKNIDGQLSVRSPESISGLSRRFIQFVAVEIQQVDIVNPKGNGSVVPSVFPKKKGR